MENNLYISQKDRDAINEKIRNVKLKKHINENHEKYEMRKAHEYCDKYNRDNYNTIKNTIGGKEKRFSSVPKTKHYFENTSCLEYQKNEHYEFCILYDNNIAKVFYAKIITENNNGDIRKYMLIEPTDTMVEIENVENDINTDREIICENEKIKVNDLLKVCLQKHMMLYHAIRIIR